MSDFDLTELRYLLQIAAHADINTLNLGSLSHLEGLENCFNEEFCATTYRPDIEQMLDQLGLSSKIAREGTPLSRVKKLLLPRVMISFNDYFEIAYNGPTLLMMSKPAQESTKAMIVVPTPTFTGINRRAYKTLISWGIRFVQIVFRNASNEIVEITRDYVRLEESLERDVYSMETEPTSPEQRIILVLVIIFVIVVVCQIRR